MKPDSAPETPAGGRLVHSVATGVVLLATLVLAGGWILDVEWLKGRLPGQVTTVLISVSVAGIWWAAWQLGRSERALQTGITALKQQKFALDQHSIVAVTDAQGRITYVNDKFCAISQYAREELLGQNHRQINSGHHPKEFFAAMYHTLTAGTVWRGEICNRAKDGSLYWVDTTIVPLLGPEGKPLNYVAIRTDITERKRATEALRQANELLEKRVAERTFALNQLNGVQRAVLDGTVFGIIATKPDGMIEIFNRGAERMLGYAAGELVGRQTPLVIHVAEEVKARAAELSEQLERRIEPGFETFVAQAKLGRADEREWTYVRKDGSQFPVLLCVTALRDETGSITGYLGVAQDLTERRQAQVALQNSEERLHRVLNHADCLVWEAEVALTEGDWAWSMTVHPSGLYRRLTGKEESFAGAGLWYQFEIPEQGEMNRRSRAALETGASGYDQEFRLLREGQVSWIRESVAITRTGQNQFWVVGVAVDITENKRMTAARDEIATRLGKLGTMVPGMIFQFRLRPDGSSCLPYANEGIRQIYHLTPEEVREDASKIFTVLHPEDLVAVAESIQRSARTLEPWNHEYRTCRPDGEVRWLSGSSVPEREADGSVLWHGFITDVTERKELEEAVRRERELLRTVLDLLPNAVYLKDRDSRILMANQALARCLGKDDPDEVLELRDHDLFSSDVAALFRADEEAVLNGREIREKEETSVFPDGRLRTYLTTKVPFRNAAGKISGILGTGIEITERKQAEAILQITRTRLEMTFAAMSEGLVLQDAQGLILDCNPAAERILGLKRNRIAGRVSVDPTWHCLREDGTGFPGAEHPSMVTLRTGLPQRDVIMGVHRSDDSLGWIEINSELIGLPGDPARQVICSFRDVSARRAAVEAMRASEERFRTLAAHAPVGIFQTDLGGYCLYVNEKWSALTGLSVAAAASQAWWTTLHPEDQVTVAGEWERLRLGEKNFAAEFRFLHPDGCIVWVAGRAEELRDAAGSVIGFLGTVSDITANKESEFALRASAAELARQKFALDQHSIVATTDIHGRITYANDKFCEISQYSRDELIGQDHRLINSGYHPKEFFAAIYRTITAGEVWHGEICNRAKDGSLYWEDSTIVPISGVDGKPIRFVSIRTNMTERKDAEQATRRALHELEQQKFALDQHALVTTTDVQGRIIHANRKFCAISRYHKEELLGKTHQLINAGVHSKEFFAAMYVKIASGEVWQHEVCNRAKDGSLFWADTTIVPFMGADKKPTHYIAIRTDITERKQLGASLAQARDQALEASRLKSEFLATMSHEIRTPMNAVIGMTGLLADTPLNAKQSEMTRIILGGAESLLTIINDILDFSRIEAGRMRIDPAEFNFNQTVEETVALLASRAHEKQLELTCEIVPWSGAWLLGDNGRVRQMLTNLIGNAIKFTDRGEVDVKVQATNETDKSIRLCVTIRDTGVGISRDAQQRLFQPFMQADGSTTRRFGGTGLGLAITRQLVELMGGKIGYESTEGHGSTFWFELEFPRCGPLPAFSAGLPPGRRALVVDDNKTNRRIVLAQLQHLGVTAEAVADGQAALARLRDPAAGPWDFVLLDWQMPGMNGVDLATIIRANPTLADLPLVMLSSAGQLAAAQEFEVGFAGFLNKPVSEMQLKRCLLRVLNPSAMLTASEGRAPEAKSRGLKILLVEDNQANQRVATMLLEKLGYEVEQASNGLLGLERLAANSYDAVLMDCQMPVLDGYATTRRIRSGTLPGVNPRVPIIALTAYARAEDRARCLNAGMDEYVSKPIRASELEKALDRCRVGVASPASLAAAEITSGVFDLEALETTRSLRDEQGRSLLAEMVNLFLSDESVRLAELQQLIDSRQADELAQDVHSFGGNAASFGGAQVRQVALELETAARSGNWDEVSARMADLKLACSRLKDGIGQLNLDQP